MWTDKEGKKLNYKEFISRWKEGIVNITILQQTKQQFNSMFIIITGLLCGIAITFLNIKSMWWLCIILVGGLFNTLIMMIGVYQKKVMLERIEKEVQNEINE